MITNISNAYIGDASISRIYQGDELVYVTGHPDILLTYIANGPDDNSGIKSVYYDTGVIPDSSIKVEISCSSYTIDKSVNLPIISGADANWRGFGIFLPINYGNVTSRLGGSYVDGPQIVSNTKYIITTYQSTSTQGDMIVNGTAYSHATTDVYGTTSAYLFAYNVNGTVNISASHTGMKIYYCKVWEANNLIRFYIPVLHYINGQYTPCFYDKVNDTYIYNLGTDTPTYKISGDYLLDYLGTEPETEIPTTASYNMRFDSSVVANINLQTDAKVRGVYGREHYLIGSATDGTTTPTWQNYGIGFPGNLYRLRANGAAYETGTIAIDCVRDTEAVNGIHTFSMFYDSSIFNVYFDSSILSNPNPAMYFSSNTIHMFNRHGNSQTVNPSRGDRIYYANFTNSNIPAKTYIPVLHNNQATFLDLNSGTYIYNLGTYAPYYQFKR